MMSHAAVIVVAVCAAAVVAAVAADCVWKDEADAAADKPTIDCSLRILDFRRNSSDVPGARRVHRLNVVCSDVFFFESQLRSDHFGHLPHLQELSIRFCKIRQLPPRSFVGLSKLLELRINTFNADWTSLVFEPDYESLVGLDRLERVDLTDNNIRTLPPGLLCPLHNVRVVNLSRNAIADLADLGVGDRSASPSCRVPLHTLVLSSNVLRSAPPRSLTAFHKLKNLDLSHNALGVLVENSFKDLDSLEVLDLSHNRLVALPPKLFASTSKLTVLQLANNSLGTIDVEAFSNLTALRVLNLSGNSLDENWIRPGIFSGLARLAVLDLSANHISKIDHGLLSDLVSLRVLDLSDNKLHTLASNLFAHQGKLEVLVLSCNELETLHHQTLTGLKGLQSLSIDHNKLHSLDNVALKNCTSLKEIALNNNFLTEVPKALHNLESVQSLDLSSNVIGFLKLESLQGLPQLRTLKLARNEISRVGKDAFREVRSLLHLDLSGNRLQTLDQETFKSVDHLQALNLAENQLEDINGLLHTQISLKWVNVSHNRLAWFDYAFFPPGLQYLDVRANRFDALGNYYNLLDNYDLRYLDAGGNRISSLGPTSLLQSLEDVILSENRISHIAANTFLGKNKLRQVHLDRNDLSSLERASLMVSTYNAAPMFYMADNPLVCNCHLQWFKHINTKVTQFPQVMDMDRVECALPSPHHTSTSTSTSSRSPKSQVLATARNSSSRSTAPDSDQRVPISQVNDDQFLCQYETHCLPKCLCCDFFSCDCHMKCPKGCQCFHNEDWSANVIVCSNRGHSAMPKVIPMDTTALYLDANNFTRLSSALLMGRSRLKQLSIARNHVTAINNQTFSGLRDLRLLNLAGNQLKQLHGYEFEDLVVLRELFLQNNQLVSISSDVFKPMQLLSVLRLDGNLLIAFPVWELSLNSNLNYLTLANNWWQCDCDFARKFRMYLDGNVDVVADAKSITCTSSAETAASECGGLVGFNAPSEKAFPNGGIVGVAVAGAALTALFLVAVVLIFRWRESCLVWLHAKYGIRILARKARPSESESAPSLLFEALVFYSSKDDAFVTGELVSKLQLHSFRLCLLHRDLSGIYTSEGFKSALEASARQVVVLSSAFLATEWEHVREVDMKNLIVVQIEDLESEAEASGVRAFLKSARKVLRFPDKFFWRTLRFHLPDPCRSAPAREGGAELDVSGVWTFTSMDGINASGISTAKLLATPSATPTMQYFPSPPMRKQPHQCSTHYLAGAPPPPPLHQRSLSVEANYAVPPTRSCGTNVIHQRSMSTASPAVASFQTLALTDSGRPPTPPPKQNSRHSIYNLPRPTTANAPAASILQQLVSSCPNPELRGRLLPQSSMPMTSTPVAEAPQHRRCSSLLSPQEPQEPSARSVVRGPHFRHHHARSSSMLAAVGGTPRRHLQHVTRTASTAGAGLGPGAARTSNGLHKSYSSLMQGPAAATAVREDGDGAVRHARSASTPHQGFVL